MRIEYNGVNTNKLHDELITAGIVPVLVESLGEKTWVTYADGTDMGAAQAVVAAHNPTPQEPEPTDVEKLQAENVKLNEMLAQTNADFASFMDYYFTINPE